MKLLVVEDERLLASSIIDFLKNDGYICEVARDYDMADEKIILYQYDCILLDIMLPGGNGLDLISLIKKNQEQAGIIIITARNAVDDRIKGLNMGADDYLIKPFHLSELNARVKSVIRRRSFGGSTAIQFNEISVLPDERNVTVHGKEVLVTKKEFELLMFFLANKNRVLSKEAIAEHLWGDNIDSADSFDFIYSQIKNLRKKLIKQGGEDYIKTIYGMGYKFTDG